MNFFSLLLGKNPLSRVFDTVDHYFDNDTERFKTKAELANNWLREQSTTQRMQMSFFMFWVVWSMFAVPLGGWWCAVMLDTTFNFGWGVSNLPMTIKPWADQIFNSLFYSGLTGAGLQTTSSLVSKALSIFAWRRG